MSENEISMGLAIRVLNNFGALIGVLRDDKLESLSEEFPIVLPSKGGASAMEISLPEKASAVKELEGQIAELHGAKKRHSVATPFCTKNGRFTKTGSGKT